MDKIDIAVLGVGVFAATQLANNLMSKDQSGHMGTLLRAENTDMQNLSNTGNDNSSLTGTDATVIPGIALDEFESRKYKVRFRYPATWRKNPRYEDKYEGESGFFEVGAFEGTGDNIDEAVQSQINEDYKPYGTNPIVRRFVVDGQPARVIYSSEDQPDFYNDRDVAIVVQYPRPVQDEDKSYDYVVIWTLPEYVPLIISTLRFVTQ
ncbi:MAG: hypothetical protein E7231_02885 [Cellulosilyticum sp.]|nr:hypothetical protein [Cellulosilyticum sp.]